MNRNAVVLFSGGMDSATLLEIAKAAGFRVFALSMDYGQRHRVELQMAAQFLARYPVQEHKIISVNLTAFGGSALTSSAEVPKSEGFAVRGEIPVTYVPARNSIFLSLALAYAETIEANDVFFGPNALDGHHYPDCRPEFVRAFENMANVMRGKPDSIQIHTPLLKMDKGEILKTGLELGIDFGLTISCYDPSPDLISCGRCDACHLRKDAFRVNGIPDPTRYRSL